MADRRLLIKSETLAELFKKATPSFASFYRQIQHAAGGFVDPPNDRYPLFEHLVIFLYCRCIAPVPSKKEFFGSRLSVEQRTNIGEAMDALLYHKLVPQDSSLGFCLSFLYLCHHERFGFMDDPVLLQRMWYIRSYIILSDVQSKVDPGQRFKWYDDRLTLAIYSWVRHNRGYHGCPRQGCNCRRMIDLYLVPIGTFKAMYMAVEEVCITQLAFVRAKNPVWPPAEGGKSLSRAVEAGLYLTPNSKSWPPCLVKHISNPDPPRGGASSNPLHLDAKQGRQATRSSAGMAPPPAPQRARSSNQLTPNPGPISPADEDDSSKTSESTAINDSSAPETVKSKVELVGDAKGHPSEVPSRANLDLLEKIFGGASDHPELDSSRQQLPASATDTKEVVQARPRDINLASLDSSKKFITTGPKMTDNDDTPLDKPPPSIKSNKRQILTARKTTGIIRPTGRFTQNGVGVLVPRRRRLSTAGGEPSLSQGKPGMEQDRSDSIQSESPTKASFGTAQLPIELTDPEKSSPHIPGDSTTAADKMQADASGSHLEGRDNTPVSSASSIHEQNIRAPRESELIGARKRLHVQLQESDRMVESQVSRSSPGPLSPSLEGISLITTHLTKRAKITEHLTSKDVHQVLLTPSTKHFVDQSGTSESKAIGSEKDVAIPQVVKTMEDETIAAANAMSSTLKILSHLAGKSLSDRGETGDEDTSTTSSRSKSSRISKTSPGKRKKPSLGVRSTSDTSTHSRANSARFLTPTSPASLTKSQIQSGDPPSGPSTSVSPAPLLPHEPYPESSGGTQNHSPPVTILEDQSIIQIMTGINSEETISFSSSDEALQLLLPTQEARRLLCILVGFGIPLEWDMVSISREGITVRDENRELVTSYMNEECVRLLSGRGIRISIGPREMLSPDDVREISNATVCRMDDSVTRLGDVDARISIVDTRCERWRRHPLWEVSRLQNIIRTILKVELPPNEDINKIDLGVQISDQYRATTLLLPPPLSQQLNAEDTAKLSLHGIATFSGYSQIDGPLLPSSSPSTSQNDISPVDGWRAMRAEVLKMKLPWESTHGSAPHRFSGHSSTLSYPYVFKPLSKLATAGIRWTDDERDGDLSDADSDFEIGGLRPVLQF